MAEWLRTFAVFPENPSLVPSTLINQLTKMSMIPAPGYLRI